MSLVHNGHRWQEVMRERGHTPAMDGDTLDYFAYEQDTTTVLPARRVDGVPAGTATTIP